MTKRGQKGGKYGWYGIGIGKYIKGRYHRARRQALRLEARGMARRDRGLPNALSCMKYKDHDKGMRGW